MTELNELIQTGAAPSSDFVAGSLSIAPMVYDLIDHLPSMQQFVVERAVAATAARFEPIGLVSAGDTSRSAATASAPAAAPFAAADVAPEVDPVARELHERRIALISAAQRRTGRRTRLRAAWTAEMSIPGGRLGDFGADTNAFVEAMRADIARAQLQSQRPSMFSYVLRRLGLHRVSMSPELASTAAR